MKNNVGSVERWASLVIGAGLVSVLINRRTPASIASAAIGGALLVRGATGYCPAYHAMDVDTSDAARNATVPYGSGIQVEESITINKPASEIYAFWRNFSNLSRFMDHLQEVRVIDSKRSHWVAKAPAGTTVEWDAEIINEIENSMISWRSVGETAVDNAGSVHFTAVAPRFGTEIKVLLRYNPPAGKLGAAVAKLFGEEPSVQIASDLRRLKQLLETGEEATVKGQPSGRA